MPARRGLNAKKLFRRQYEGVFLAHRRDVIEPVEIRDSLQIGFVFNQFFGAAMQQADMRIHPLDDFAVHFHNHAQNTVRRRMLRAEIQGQVLDFCFSRHHSLLASAFSSPGN